ncbi:histidinol-phosphatase HisJ family protein [Patescibacteria group bacterium]|nr:histidinol-phosphatase HisJ family protein [Patescibacteria group bacterium]
MKDYHIHSGFLDHTKDDLGAIVETADRLGFEEIAITEHLIWTAIVHPKKGEDTLFVEQSQIPNDGRQTTDLQTYAAEIERISQQFRMRILKGVEVDYFNQYEDEIHNLLERFHFDLVLGSCHYVRDERRPEDEQYLHVGLNAGMRVYLEQYGTEHVYRAYFENVANAVKSGLFDYMAHLDFIKKAIPDYSHRRAFGHIAPILGLMVERNVGLEINVKGFERFNEPFPSYDVIDEYRRLGGRKISIGSDAHGVQQIINSKSLIEQHTQQYA